MDQTLDSNLIRSVSRSFSLTLLALPRAQRHAVGLTYLLARFADTLTDSGKWTVPERIAHLEAWENAILRKDSSLWILKGSVGSFRETEAHLLLEGQTLLKAHIDLSTPQQVNADEVLKTLISGMKWDLKTFGAVTSAAPIYGCKDVQAFDWYCYSIAGCVGPYWVKTFNLPTTLEPLATEYGKGLQRVNILRDVVEDWGRGRVYLPQKDLSQMNLEGGQPWKSEHWKDFVSDYIKETRRKLRHGANFCDAIPKSQRRLRWASMMPLAIGLETLKLIGRENRFSEKPMKISRSVVKKLAWRGLIDVIFGRSISRRAELRD